MSSCVDIDCSIQWHGFRAEGLSVLQVKGLHVHERGLCIELCSLKIVICGCRLNTNTINKQKHGLQVS